MQVTIVTVGSRGDLQPYVALGCGLQAAGHSVRVATHRPYEQFVREYGLAFAPLAGNPREILGSDAGLAWMQSGGNPLRFARSLSRVLEEAVEAMTADVVAACRGTGVILYSTLGFIAGYAGRKLGIPTFAAPLQPLNRTRAFPNIGLPQDLPGGGLVNWLSHLVMEQLFWQPLRPRVNRWLEETLDLPPEPLWGPFYYLHREQRPVLYGFSRHVVPKPADWGDHIHLTGYWFLNGSEAWRPPADLLAFLERRPQPIYVGFGSMTTRDPQAFTETVRRALDLTGRSAVVLSGWGALDPADLGPDVYPVEQVPHDWLFPRVAAVVHHGGAGTTAAGLRAGTPTVVVPFFADQNFWAGRVAALGVGPRPLPLNKLSAGRLAAAILQATADESIREQAALTGRQLRAEDGVQRAVSLLETLC